jgi:hypothetical protein
MTSPFGTWELVTDALFLLLLQLGDINSSAFL